MSVHLILYFHLHNCDSLYLVSIQTAVSRTHSKGVSEIKTSHGVAFLISETRRRRKCCHLDLKSNSFFMPLMFWWKTKLPRVKA